MERRKRVVEKDGDEFGGGRRKKKVQQQKQPVKNKTGEATGEVEGDVATEEEVEEFFAIVRRMQAAVNYFEKSAGKKNSIGSNGDHHQIQSGWRAVLESTEQLAATDAGAEEEEAAAEAEAEAVVVVAAEVQEDANNNDYEEINGVLDLNETPDDHERKEH